MTGDQFPLPGMPVLTVAELTKRCRICGEQKLLDEFHLASSGHRGKYRSECKSCGLELARATRAGKPLPQRRLRRTTCLDCGAVLTDENAYRKSGTARFRSRCTSCYGVVRRAKHDAAEEQRRAHLASTNCEICGAAETVTRGGRVRRPTIDHNHATGERRGLLCSRCNAGLGMFRDNPALLRAAANYLDRYGHAAVEAVTGDELDLAGVA